MNQQKPILLLLLGVEGSGHHMIQSFLGHFFRSEKAIRNGGWYPYLYNRWDALEREPKETRLDLKTQTELKTEFERLITHHATQTDFMYTSASFPYGHDRDTLRRPDIIELTEVLGPYVDIRPIVLHRDPVSCAYSAVRRGFTDNVLLQARFVEDNLIFIKQQLEASQLNYKTLCYENFVSKPLDYSAGFEQWWKVSNESFLDGVSKIKPSTSKSQIPNDAYTQLNEFFSPMRKMQWHDFLQSNNL